MLILIKIGNQFKRNYGRERLLTVERKIVLTEFEVTGEHQRPLTSGSQQRSGEGKKETQVKGVRVAKSRWQDSQLETHPKTGVSVLGDARALITGMRLILCQQFFPLAM